MLDSGVCVIYRAEGDETAPPPAKRTLAEQSRHCFGDRTVGLSRYYAAARVGQRIDRLIRIWRDEAVNVRNLCAIGGRYYLIRKVTPTADEDGLLVTDLDLEETDEMMWRKQNEPKNFGG